MQLARTRSKQEEDIVAPFKQHDDVEIRQTLVERLLQDNRDKNERMKKLEEQLANLQEHILLRSNNTSHQQQSPIPPRMEEYSRDLGRLPKHKWTRWIHKWMAWLNKVKWSLTQTVPPI